MNSTILSTYEITSNTLALIPAAQIDYDTIVLEPQGQLHVRKTPMQLIEPACLEGGASYDGRRLAVSYQTGSRKKIPIPINPLDEIYAFPTHSPKQFNCHWIFYHHVKAIKPHHQLASHAIVTFKSGQQLTLPVSYHTLERQMHRTSHCIIRFS